jgi:hypothetical protein
LVAIEERAAPHYSAVVTCDDSPESRIVDGLLVERVGALLTGYSDALLSCERLPRLGSVKVSYVTRPHDPSDQVLTRKGTVTIPGIRALLDADAGRQTRNPATATVRASRTYARLYLHDHVFG